MRLKPILLTAGLVLAGCGGAEPVTEAMTLGSQLPEAPTKLRAAIGDHEGKCEQLANKVCEQLGAESEHCKVFREKLKQPPPAERCALAYEHLDQFVADTKKFALVKSAPRFHGEKRDQDAPASPGKVPASTAPTLTTDSSGVVLQVSQQQAQAPQ
jgi:hypothetical protein